MSDQVPEHWRRFFGGSACTSAPLPETKSQPEQGPVTVQKTSEGNLLKQVKPSYPELAKRARLQGAVVLDAVIGKEGKVRCLSVLQPLGAGTEEISVDAVKQWIYRPYLLNGQAVEVQTKITLNYILEAR